jgi:hypothetical protein
MGVNLKLNTDIMRELAGELSPPLEDLSSACLMLADAAKLIDYLRAEIERLRAQLALWNAAKVQPEELHRQCGEMLVRIALQVGDISYARAAELLGCSLVDIRERGWEQGPGLDVLLGQHEEEE